MDPPFSEEQSYFNFCVKNCADPSYEILYTLNDPDLFFEKKQNKTITLLLLVYFV